MARTKLSEAKKCKIKVEENEEVEENEYCPDDQPKHKIINCWSGPRSLSTSLMYSFHNRGDAECFDEPFYAHYLRDEIAANEINGIEDPRPRPYVDLVLDKQNADGGKVLDELLYGDRNESSREFRFVKHMAKHATTYMPRRKNNSTECEYDRLGDYLERCENFILVRHPEDIVRSFGAVATPTLDETCLPSQLEIFMMHTPCRHGKINRETEKMELPTLKHRKRHPPMPVVLSEDLRDNPEGTLRALCKAVNIDFKPEMLKWKAGPRPEIDGCWAPWWYKTTHESTCFAPPRENKPPPPPLSEDLQALVDECMPYYQFLKSHAMKPDVIERRGEDDGRNDAATTSQTLTRTHAGTHAYAADPRNDSVLIGMRDGVTDKFSLVPRKDAKVSVFDSGFVLGDGVWEGIRLHDGVLMYVDEHVKRLYQGAKAIDMEIGVTQAGLIKMMYETVDANQMKSGVHIRLMVTRGLKSTPYQNPTFTVGKPTIVIAAEHKPAAEAPKVHGMRLMTTHVRRGAPDVQDPAWNSHSKLNCIAACIQANKAGVDESLMLDPHGFVATCNSVHFFIVVDGVVLTSRRKYILHGITRDNVMRIANGIGLEVREDDFTLTAVYSAEECFVTGTFAGVLPVREVDGRQIGDGKRGPVVKRLQEAYVREVNAVASRGRRRA